jgi:outer membrane protein OmpA-like peptidoglycan-associated protein
MMKYNYRTLITAAILLTSSACTVTTRIVAEPQASHGVHEQSTRITDAVIEDDMAYINSLRTRLEILNATGTQIEGYHFCKAQTWVDMAFDEYTDNDRSEVVAAALEQAETIITGLEQGAEISMATPVIATSKYLREDLWASAEAAKSSAAFECAACDVARLEVQLVWIGHETNELGWRHAESEIMAAERIERRIRKTAASCQGIEETQLLLPDRLHFAYDSSAITPQSAAVLKRIAEHMHSDEKIRLQLKGHADETGSSDYNLALSQRRANAAREFLLDKGISTDRVTLRALGELDPLKTGRSREARAYNRRVELALITAKYINVENLYQDLQP